MLEDKNAVLLIIASVSLLTSLLTVFLSKIFDYFFAKQQFNQNLKEKFFERKLQVAEANVKSHSLAAIALEAAAQRFLVAPKIQSDEIRNIVGSFKNEVLIDDRNEKDLLEIGDLLKLFFEIDIDKFKLEEDYKNIIIKYDKVVSSDHTVPNSSVNVFEELIQLLRQTKHKHYTIIDLIQKSFTKYKA